MRCRKMQYDAKINTAEYVTNPWVLMLLYNKILTFSHNNISSGFWHYVVCCTCMTHSGHEWTSNWKREILRMTWLTCVCICQYWAHAGPQVGWTNSCWKYFWAKENKLKFGSSYTCPLHNSTHILELYNTKPTLFIASSPNFTQ